MRKNRKRAICAVFFVLPAYGFGNLQFAGGYNRYVNPLANNLWHLGNTWVKDSGCKIKHHKYLNLTAYYELAKVGSKRLVMVGSNGGSSESDLTDSYTVFGINFKADSYAEIDSDSYAEIDSDSGADCGTDSGVDSGAYLGADSGDNSGVDSSADSTAEIDLQITICSGNGTRIDSRIGISSGMKISS